MRDASLSVRVNAVDVDIVEQPVSIPERVSPAARAVAGW